MPDDAPQYSDPAEAIQANRQQEYLQSRGIVQQPGGGFLDTNTGTFPTNPVQAAQVQDQRQATQKYGMIIPSGGGPPMIATPDNVAQFGGASDLADMAIRSRQQFEQRRRDLYSHLAGAPRRQQAGIAAEIKGMEDEEHQRRFEATQSRVIAHQSMQSALQQAKLDRETDIDQHGAALVESLPRLRGMLRNGQITKDAYDTAVLDQIGKYGALGMHHPGAAQLVNHYIEEADKQNAFQQRRSASEATKLAGKYGIEPQVDPETGLPSVEHTRAAALQTPKGRVEMLTSLNQEMKQKYGLGTGVSSLFNPVAPHSSPDKGKTIDIPYLEPKTGKIGKANIPTPLFEQMKADFGDRYFATIPQQNTGTHPEVGGGGEPISELSGKLPITAYDVVRQNDPRTELAKRALNDPNASEAHKVAARRILGIQDNAQ